MKNISFIIVFITISLLSYSCSSDDSYEMQVIQKNNINIKQLQNFNKEVNEKKVDSSEVKIETKTADGDPSNTIPPRK
jgi:hypothetical protein